MDKLPGEQDQKPGVVGREAAFVFIFATVFLDMLAIGIIIPVLPKLVVDFVGGDAEEAARILGLFGTAWALMQFVFSPLQGALSDRFGRRPLIVLSNFGVGLDYVLIALAPNLAWLFAGRVISGITAASIATAYAYIADVTPRDKRAARFGLLGAAFGAGFVLGPALGGLAGTISPRLPFWIAAILSLANAFYGLVVLPESLPLSKRAPFRWQRANPFGAFLLLRSHAELSGLAVVNFLGNLAHAVLPSIGVLYMLYRYGWDERTVGLTLASVGVASIFVQGGIVGKVTKWIGERSALLTGFVFGVLGFLVLGLAQTGVEFWAGIPLMALWGLEGPACLALMSRLVGESEQGQLQGANAGISGIANLLGPGLFAFAFAFAIGPAKDWSLPGMPFLVAMALLAAAGVIGWKVTRTRIKPAA
jgi:MFS transporter, DHA1 family, tetracycline resistance protein